MKPGVRALIRRCLVNRADQDRNSTTSSTHTLIIAIACIVESIINYDSMNNNAVQLIITKLETGAHLAHGQVSIISKAPL